MPSKQLPWGRTYSRRRTGTEERECEPARHREGAAGGAEPAQND